jgi:hypothetical protein
MSTTDPEQPKTRPHNLAAWLVGPVLLGLAVWFLWGPPLTRVPHKPLVLVPLEPLSTAVRRQIIGDPPTIEIAGFTRVCTDCHALFPLGTEPIADRRQHEHIVLDHGINDTCRNCHDVTNMNRLVLYSGESISYTEVPNLCQKCHGPTFRDWERGIHGRVNDYWDPRSGPPRKLKCIECHDPHRPRTPAMEPLEPLPRPDTLRMGTPPTHRPRTEDLAEGDPLRRALIRPEAGDDSESGAAEHPEGHEEEQR